MLPDGRAAHFAAASLQKVAWIVEDVGWHGSPDGCASSVVLYSLVHRGCLMNCYRPVWMPHRVVLLLLLLLLSVALLAGCGSNAPSGDGSSDALQQNVINVIQQVQPSVVEIESRGTQGASI